LKAIENPVQAVLSALWFAQGNNGNPYRAWTYTWQANHWWQDKNVTIDICHPL